MIDWNPRLVIDRIVEAYDVMRRLPGPRRPHCSAMPWYDAHQSFEEAVWAEEGRQRTDAVGKVLVGKDHLRTPQTYWAETFTKSAPPDSDAIDRAFKALDWLRYLGGKRDLVDALWFCHGKQLGPTDASRAIARYRKARPQSRETVRLKRDKAVSMIVSGLRADQAAPHRRVGLRLRAGLSASC